MLGIRSKIRPNIPGSIAPRPIQQSAMLMPEQEANFAAMMQTLNQTQPKPMPHGQGNAPPPRPQPPQAGLMGQPQQSPVQGLFAQQFEKPKMTWSDKLGLISGMLMDYDGTMGSGNADAARARYDQRVAEAQGQFDQNRNEQLMMAAAQGDPMALAMLDPIGARNFAYQQGRDASNDQYRDMVFNTQTQQWERRQGFDEMNADRNFGLQQDQFGLQRDQFGWQVGTDARDFAEGQRQFDLTYGLDRDKLTAEAAADGAGVAPALAGLPTGVQSAIVTKELGGLDASEEAVGKARNAANIARAFMADSEGYGALGGGPLADIGQAASQKTALLKGHTARMIPMMRSPGEGEMTDSDAKRYELSVVSINKGRDANQRVVEDLERFEANEVARDNFLRQWQAQNGYGSVGQAKLIWQQYANAEPIFDPETGKPRERRDIYTWLQSQGGMTPAPSATTSTQSGPPVGTVRNGYRFKGGNPNDRNSWEPAQ